MESTEWQARRYLTTGLFADALQVRHEPAVAEGESSRLGEITMALLGVGGMDCNLKGNVVTQKISMGEAQLRRCFAMAGSHDFRQRSPGLEARRHDISGYTCPFWSSAAVQFGVHYFWRRQSHVRIIEGADA